MSTLFLSSLSDIVCQQIALCKNKIKTMSFYWFWFFFFSLNCHVCLFLPYESMGNKSLSPFPNTFIAHTVLSDFFLKKMVFNSIFSEISLLVPSLLSSPFSRLCVWKMLFEASNQKSTLEVARNLLCFYKNYENYSCWNTFWWKACQFF